jgi:adenylate kinase family enzyme
MKITIIGTSGSGKSTLSRKMSEDFQLPRVEIDRIWFKHNGHKYLNGTAEEKDAVTSKVAEEIQDFISNKKLEDFTKQYSQKLVVLRNFKEIDNYFESLKALK